MAFANAVSNVMMARKLRSAATAVRQPVKSNQGIFVLSVRRAPNSSAATVIGRLTKNATTTTSQTVTVAHLSVKKRMAGLSHRPAQNRFVATGSFVETNPATIKTMKAETGVLRRATKSH
jgi:hypothetical protein